MNLGKISSYRTQIMGLACMYIVAHHNFFDWPNALLPVKRFFSVGNIGVEIFLLVSGVGLYYSFSSNRNVFGFYRKRYTRLLLPYILFAVPYYLWLSLVGQASFWRSFFQIDFPLKGLQTTWYVTAIAVFYAFFPLIFLLQNRPLHIRSKKIDSDIITAGLCIVYFVFLLLLQKLFPVLYQNCEIGLTRFPIFVIGCWLGKTVKEKKHCPRPIVVFFISSFLIYVLFFRNRVSIPTFWTRMLYIPLSIGVLFLFVALCSKFRNIKPLDGILRFFGYHSLEIYLSHVMIKNVYLHYFEYKKFDKWDIVSYLIIVTISVLLSAIVHPLIERLFKNLFRKPADSTTGGTGPDNMDGTKIICE